MSQHLGRHSERRSSWSSCRTLPVGRRTFAAAPKNLKRINSIEILRFTQDDNNTTQDDSNAVQHDICVFLEIFYDIMK
jgi:hypothetical protein